ncbi:outer membrane immunogenic protein [Rhizobium sp. ERR 922]|uniref:Outer membrane protein n=1 Tax=Rhizobium dioscoreae TaxID=2653122 RepID=A0ABQ0Z2V0_9HYPH|nr:MULTISPECIES: outer membrane protein [Rhizobium]MCZ3380604.1 porin family protein [Rhizobium sp. AG207R]TWB20129.1 outer membrane immunogenic protein [Rhizobium sp. ERR1071]TWB55114.1 outer membrane immunogenic protein [Rhizobium sp. ERR 922]TWB97551.1 outer membrane immunogenic protein [Rhizobium sp. ERR 942]GES44807.1 outer membrane protein [Rhizobium dioscoreae]
MRTLITTLMVSAFALGGYTAAQAADAVEQIPQPPVAQEAAPAVNNWSGFYIGGAGDWNAGHFNRNGDAYAWGGQAFTGYNWQQGQIVYGIEADLGYSGADSTRNGLTAKNGVNGSVRGRLGYDFNPFMLYGTAGLALGQNKLSDDTSSDSKTAVGYTVGAGAETFITNNITARLEYRYTDYGKKNFDLDSGRFSRGYDEQSVKVGIGVKF